MMGSIIDFNDGYITFSGPSKSMSLIDLYENEPMRFHSKNGGSWKDERFARDDKTSFDERLDLKILVPGSTNKRPDAQARLLSKLEYVTNVAEIVWVLVMYKAVRGIYLIPHICVRTSSYGDDGYPIVVGRDSDDGIIIRSWKGNPDGMIGMAAKKIL